MSNFDPTVPDHVPAGATILWDRATYAIEEGNSATVPLLASAVRSANATVGAISNPTCRGGIFVLDVTALPASGSTTVALKVQIADGVGGRAVTIASRAAVSATGVYALVVYPGISASAGGVASPLPKNIQCIASISAGATNKDTTFSLSMQLIK